MERLVIDEMIEDIAQFYDAGGVETFDPALLWNMSETEVKFLHDSLYAEETSDIPGGFCDTEPMEEK